MIDWPSLHSFSKPPAAETPQNYSSSWGRAPKPSKNFMANPGEPIADSMLWFRLLYWHSELAMWSVLLHHSRHDWEYQTQALSEVIYPYPLNHLPAPCFTFPLTVSSFLLYFLLSLVFISAISVRMSNVHLVVLLPLHFLKVMMFLSLALWPLSSPVKSVLQLLVFCRGFFLQYFPHSTRCFHLIDKNFLKAKVVVLVSALLVCVF